MQILRLPSTKKTELAMLLDRQQQIQIPRVLSAQRNTSSILNVRQSTRYPFLNYVC